MGRKKTPLLENRIASICLGLTLNEGKTRKEIIKGSKRYTDKGVTGNSLTRYIGTGENKGKLLKKGYMKFEEEKYNNVFYVNYRPLVEALNERLQKEINEKYTEISKHKTLPKSKYLNYNFSYYTSEIPDFIMMCLKPYIKRLLKKGVYVKGKNAGFYSVYKSLVFELGRIYDQEVNEIKEKFNDKGYSSITAFLNACVYYRKINNMNKLNVFYGKEYGDIDHLKNILNYGSMEKSMKESLGVNDKEAGEILKAITEINKEYDLNIDENTETKEIKNLFVEAFRSLHEKINEKNLPDEKARKVKEKLKGVIEENQE